MTAITHWLYSQYVKHDNTQLCSSICCPHATSIYLHPLLCRLEGHLLPPLQGGVILYKYTKQPFKLQFASMTASATILPTYCVHIHTVYLSLLLCRRKGHQLCSSICYPHAVLSYLLMLAPLQVRRPSATTPSRRCQSTAAVCRSQHAPCAAHAGSRLASTAWGREQSARHTHGSNQQHQQHQQQQRQREKLKEQ
jgi:hypothetical protein